MYIYRQFGLEIALHLCVSRNNLEHGIPLDLVEIVFLDGKGVFGLGRWWQGDYLKKIAKSMKSDFLEAGDHPYNDVSNNKQERSDPFGKHNIL